MRIVSHLALLGALVSAVQACATPVELKGCPAALPAADCDVLLASSSDFADAGLGGAAGNGSGGGGSPGPSGGGAAGGGAVGQGGASNLGGGGTGSGLGGAGQGGNSGLGGAGLGGATGGGLGGAGGGAGTGAGGTGSVGTFEPTACDFDNTAGCEDFTCAAVCPTNDGGSCLDRCVGVVECVSADECVRSEADPLCAVRPQGGGLNTCTTVAEQAGGANPNPPTGDQNPQPSFVAREFVRCICSDGRL